MVEDARPDQTNDGTQDVPQYDVEREIAEAVEALTNLTNNPQDIPQMSNYDLREILMKVLWNKEDIQRATMSVGIYMGSITWTDLAPNTWDSVLTQARSASKLSELLVATLGVYRSIIERKSALSST